MAWTRGPGTLSAVSVNGVSIDAGLVEGFSKTVEPDTFDTAYGFPAERGSVKTTFNFNCLDWSAVAAMETLMTARTPVNVIATYVDGQAQTLVAATIRIKPLIHLVPDACNVYVAAANTSKNNLASIWTDAGGTIGVPSPTFDWTWDGMDGCGRPYHSGCRVMTEFILPGKSPSTLPYTALSALKGAKVDAAFKMQSTGTAGYLTFDDCYLYYTYANEDSLTPRAIRARLIGVGAAWSNLLGYTDGGATAVSSLWGVDSAVDPGDMFAGCEVEATGFHQAETTLNTY